MSLPFKISAQPISVQHAYERFIWAYGKREGERIFLAYADEHGVGSTPRMRARSAFRKGGTVG